MQLSSDKIPTLEEFTLSNKKVAATGTLTDKEIAEFLIIKKDSPSDNKNKEEIPTDIKPVFRRKKL